MSAFLKVSHRRYQGGGTLVEVLIAVLVLSTGMLGVAAMQSVSLRNSQSALQRSQAVAQMYSVADAMRANADVARAGGYNLPLGGGCPTPSAAGTLATRDLSDWISSLQSTMGSNACGGIACAASVCVGGVCAPTLCTMTVRWDDSLGTGGGSLQQLQFGSRI
ncbi:MAG: type IV pilus modification protein PilV [Xanthomonadales bacterium]|nr:type IV pilus modification protein PilV [Xanthomonadales bacterium]